MAEEKSEKTEKSEKAEKKIEKLKSPKGKKKKVTAKASDITTGEVKKSDVTGGGDDTAKKESKKKKTSSEDDKDKDKTKKSSKSKKTIKKSSSSDKKDGEKSDKKKSLKSPKPKSKKKLVVEDDLVEKGKEVFDEENQEEEEELDPTVCRICQDPMQDACAMGSKCDHVFCLPCLEGHVTRPMKKPTEYDAYLGAPTLGRCPSCGAELKLFEVRDATTGDYLYERYYNIQETPLAGLVFTPRDKSIQLGNFHFDTDFDKKDSHGMSLPYMNFVDAIESDHEKWMLNDGSQVPQRKWFEEGCHFHEPTRTFHGSIVFGNPRFQGSYQWDVTLAFTKDYAAINVGVIHKRNERLIEPRDDLDYTQIHRYLYPCDGAWKLLWVNPAGEPKTGSVNVRGNEFQQGPYMFHLNFSEPDKPGFRWPLDPVYAAAISGVDLIEEPMGPELGERIEWETTHPAFPEIVWVRESIGPEPVPSTIHFGQGTSNHYTSNLTAEEGTMYDSDHDASSAGDASADYSSGDE